MVWALEQLDIVHRYALCSMHYGMLSMPMAPPSSPLAMHSAMAPFLTHAMYYRLTSTIRCQYMLYNCCQTLRISTPYSGSQVIPGPISAFTCAPHPLPYTPHSPLRTSRMILCMPQRFTTCKPARVTAPHPLSTNQAPYPCPICSLAVPAHITDAACLQASRVHYIAIIYFI